MVPRQNLPRRYRPSPPSRARPSAAYHQCIDTWLDQQHVCPQCRLDLLPSDISLGRQPQNATPARGQTDFAALFSSTERTNPALRLATAGTDGHALTAAAAAGAAAAAAAVAPYATYLNSPGWGSSPAPVTTNMLHLRRPSPEPFQSGGGRTRRNSTNSNTTPSSTAAQAASASVSAPRTSFLGSPAYGMSPVSMVQFRRPSLDLFHPVAAVGGRGRRGQGDGGGAAAAVIADTAAQNSLPTRGTYPHYLGSPIFVPSPVSITQFRRPSPDFVRVGTRRRGTPVPVGIGARMFSSAPFPAVDAPSRRSVAGGAASTSAARRGTPPTPNRGRAQARQPSPRHPYAVTPMRRRQPAAGGGGSGGGTQAGRSGGSAAVQGQTQQQASVAAASPPPLPRLAARPRRPLSLPRPRSARPSTPPVHPAAGSGFSTAGGAGSRRHLRLPNLGRRPRSSSCDVVGSGSSGLCVVGNASPKAGGAGERDLRLGASMWANKGWATTRPSVRVASWEEEDAGDGGGGGGTMTG